MNRFTRELNKMSDDTQSLGSKLEKHTRRHVRLQGKSGKVRQRGANRSAKSINKSAVYIEKRVALLKALVKDMERNYRGVIATADIESEDGIQQALDLQRILNENREVTVETLASVVGYRVSVEEGEAMNLSRSLRIAQGRLAKGLRAVEAIFKNYEKVSAGLVRELEDKVSAGRRHQG